MDFPRQDSERDPPVSNEKDAKDGQPGTAHCGNWGTVAGWLVEIVEIEWWGNIY